MAQVLLVQGPNLNLLGRREPEIYGHRTLESIHDEVRGVLGEAGHQLEAFQSNTEGQILDWLQARAGKADFLIINAAALTHSSIALRDTLLFLQLPFIEVHLSNLYQREAFRQTSLLADKALGLIVGLGPLGYRLAALAACAHLAAPPKPPKRS